MIVKRITRGRADRGIRAARANRPGHVTAAALATGLLAGAVLAAGCNVEWSPYAAKVGPTVVTPAQLDAEVKQAGGNASFLCLLQRTGVAGTATVTGAGTNTYDSTFVAYVLTNLINGVIAHSVAARYRLSEGTTARNLAREQVAGAFSSQLTSSQCGSATQPLLKELGAELSSSFVQLQLDEDALAARVAHVPLTTAGIAAYEHSHPGATRQSCLSGVFVKSRKTADHVASLLGGGASMASVIARYSPGAASTNGALGCYTASSLKGISAAVASQVAATSAGGITRPVSYQGAFLVMQVTSRPFEPVLAALDTIFTTAAPTFAREISRAAQQSHVQVNPQYGRWASSKALATNGFGGKVVPNKGPAAADLLNPSKLTAPPAPSTGLSGSGSGSG